jgi:hypothetical protein
MYWTLTLSNSIDVYNGGWWLLSSTYAGGWFYDNSGACVNVAYKRDELGSGPGANYTLPDGSVHTVDREVWLNMSAPGGPQVVREVRHN